MENQDKEKSNYTYSSKEQEEINKICQKYVATEDKMEQLCRLDAGFTKKATAISITVGIVGVLIMGVGMCCTKP